MQSCAAADAGLRDGDRVQVLYPVGAQDVWWNAVVTGSGFQPRHHTDTALTVAVGHAPTQTDNLRYQISLSATDLRTDLRRSWTQPCEADARPAPAAPAPAPAPSARLPPLPATRRSRYAGASARRQRRRDGHQAAAARAAAARSPAVAMRRHLLFLACTTVTVSHVILWDVCSGPFKSLASTAEDHYDNVHALTLDNNPLFSPDVLADWTTWDPFHFMMRNYMTAHGVLLPIHLHFSPPCTTYCVQTQGLHHRSPDHPFGLRPRLPEAQQANYLLACIALFVSVLAAVPGASFTVSFENPVGMFWHTLKACGVRAVTKHVVHYCRYGMARKKPTYIILSSALHFRSRRCVARASNPRRGICGHLTQATTHPGSDGAASIRDARIPMPLCADIMRSVLDYHMPRRHARRGIYNVSSVSDLQRARTIYMERRALIDFSQSPTSSPSPTPPSSPNTGSSLPPPTTPPTSFQRPAAKRRVRARRTCDVCHQAAGQFVYGTGNIRECLSCAALR